MSVPGLSIVFIYFDTMIGPNCFYKYPKISDEIVEAVTPLLGIHSENVIFSYSFKQYRLLNQNFPIISPNSRGGKIICLLSICSDKNYQTITIPNEILAQYCEKIQNIKNFDLVLNDFRNTDKNPEYKHIKTRFYDLMSDLYEEINQIIKSGKKIQPLFIPGFFTFQNEVKTRNQIRWNIMPEEPEWFSNLIDLIENQLFTEAFTVWEKIDDKLVNYPTINLRYNLVGSFLKLKLEKYSESYQLAEKSVENAILLKDNILFIDSVINLVETAAYLEMIMIFESAFLKFDAAAGYSSFSITNYTRFQSLLNNCLKKLEIGDISYTGVKIRKALIYQCLAKLNIAYIKVEFKTQLINDALIFLNRSQELLSNTPFVQHLIENLVVQAFAYDLLGQNQLAWDYFTAAERFTSELSESEQSVYNAWLTQQLGWSYFHHGLINETLQFFSKSLLEINKIKDKKSREIFTAQTDMRLGFIYFEDDQHNNQSIPLFLNALEIFQKYNYRIEIPRLFYLLGDSYKAAGKTDMAFKYYEECKKDALNDNHLECIGISYSKLAKLSFEARDFSTALPLYNQALVYFEKIHHPQFLGIVYSEIGSIYHIRGELDQATKYYLHSIESFSKESNEFQSYWVYYKLVILNIDKEINKSLEFANKLHELDSRGSNKIISQITRISEALIKSKNNKPRDRLYAEFLLEQITNEKIINPHISFAAFFHLCLLKLNDLIELNQWDLIGDIFSHLTNAALLAFKINAIKDFFLISVLNAKLAIVQLDFNQFEQIIKTTCDKTRAFPLEAWNEQKEGLLKLVQNQKWAELSIQDRFVHLNIKSDHQKFKEQISLNLLQF
jgi:tetratricopeptide (TPR) repeat protein